VIHVLPSSAPRRRDAAAHANALPRIFAVLLLTSCVATCAAPDARAGDDEGDATLSLAPILAAVDDPAPFADQVVYVDFWASWCVPCRESFPWMQRMAATYGDQGLRVVTVNLDRRSKAAATFLEEVEADLPVILDPEGKLARRFELQAMPTSFLFDRTGRQRLRHEGFRTNDAGELEAELVALLAEEPPPGAAPAPAAPAPVAPTPATPAAATPAAANPSPAAPAPDAPAPAATARESAP
jgi:thiol-disulfide isomerase/thioredoxin